MRIVAGLLFFILAAGCSNKSATVQIISDGDRAVGVSIPSSLVDKSWNGDGSGLIVKLVDSESSTGIIGEYSKENDRLIFRPLVAFSPGTQYEILYEGNTIAKFEVPYSNAETPFVVNIYPTADSLPENALKVYISFSQPMREHVALQNISLLTAAGDTVSDPFLDLQPELWNEAGDIITLWFDPGRVKRDLIPNREMGAPLISGNKYWMVINDAWKDKLGRQLRSSIEKEFVVVERDSLLPDPTRWTLHVPSIESNDPLTVVLDESLDYQLLLATISIRDEQRKVVPCQIQVEDKERQLRIVNTSLWKAGKYFLVVENRLEDLAGNNLVRPFDRDLEKTSLQGDVHSTSEVAFEIK